MRPGAEHGGDSPRLPGGGFRPEDYVAHFVHRGSLAAILDELDRFQPVAVVCGSEIGVELADALSEKLGLATNGTIWADSTSSRLREAMTEAVLFDCDGVLVDSETLIAEILVEMANERGGSLFVADGLRMFHGVQLALCVQRLSEHLGRDVTDEIVGEYQRRSEETFRQKLTAVAGVEDLVRSLTLPTGVVSNSTLQKATFDLTVTGLLPYFVDCVYSAADLDRWKPEPDVYLHAAEQLGVDPRGCVAIEDSSVGVESASRAGMTVIGFGPPKLLTSGARWTCRTMGEIAELVHDLT